MRNSKILAKIRAGRPARIAYLGHFLPRYVAHAAHQGYDGLWIDLEHNAMDTREVQMLLAFTHLYDIDGMVRVPTREKTRLYRYLEDGAAGLMVPHAARRLFGSDAGRSLPASMFLGAIFMLICDDFARVATSSELPLGVLTSLTGAVVFLLLMGSGRRVRGG